MSDFMARKSTIRKALRAARKAPYPFSKTDPNTESDTYYRWLNHHKKTIEVLEERLKD